MAFNYAVTSHLIQFNSEKELQHRLSSRHFANKDRTGKRGALTSSRKIPNITAFAIFFPLCKETFLSAGLRPPTGRQEAGVDGRRFTETCRK